MRERKRVQFFCTGESRTKQQFKKDCDINLIVAKYKRTGQVEHLKLAQGFFGDVSGVGDYQQALEKVMAANAAFDLVPSEIRKRFNHNPAELINFVADSRNKKEAIELGLIAKPVEAPREPQRAPSQPAAQGAGASQGQAGGQA